MNLQPPLILLLPELKLSAYLLVLTDQNILVKCHKQT